MYQDKQTNKQTNKQIHCPPLQEVTQHSSNDILRDECNMIAGVRTGLFVPHSQCVPYFVGYYPHLHIQPRSLVKVMGNTKTKQHNIEIKPIGILKEYKTFQEKRTHKILTISVNQRICRIINQIQIIGNILIIITMTITFF